MPKNWTDHLITALGYHELGMQPDALRALGAMPAEDGRRLEVILLRLAILQAMKQWERGAIIARDGVQSYPEAGDLYIVGAYCIRRSEDIRAAFEFLKQGQECLVKEPCFWFNLGCYHCQLGRLEEARDCVSRAIGIDEIYQKMAEEDEDLEVMRDFWRNT